MLLGDIIARLTDDMAATEGILGLGDVGLFAALRARAQENGLALGDYAVWAVRTYADNAPADEWTTLIGVMDRSDDPGSAFLKRALSYVLDRIAPAEGSGPPDNRPRGRSMGETLRLVKLALAVGASLEGVVHSHTRRALGEGISPDALAQVALLAVPTLGLPHAVQALTWIWDIAEKKE